MLQEIRSVGAEAYPPEACCLSVFPRRRVMRWFFAGSMERWIAGLLMTRRNIYPNCRVAPAATSLLLIILTLAGCAVGPNYKQPKTKAPSNFGNGDGPGFSTNDIALEWWRGFDDPQLADLIQRAVTNNLDVRIATAHLREARALYHYAQFDFGPTVNGTASYAYSKRSSASL